jgi:hypothetical protein
MHFPFSWIAVLAVTLVVAPATGQERANAPDSPRWKQFLSWLPPDTETVIVAQHAMKVPDVGPSLFNYDNVFQLVPTGPAFIVHEGVFRKELSGHKILCAVEGSRNFTFPIGEFGLGLMLYEGAHLIQFEPSAEKAVRKAFEVCHEKAEKRIELGRHKIAVFTVKEKKGSWTYLVAQPNPGLLVIATNESYLRETLTRSAEKPAKRALPDDLPEWKQVDVKADVWGIRHYRKESAEKDPTSPLMGKQVAFMPDLAAVGFVFWFDVDSKVVHVRYLTGAKDLVEMARKRWKGSADQELTFEINQLGTDCVELIGKITPNLSRIQSAQIWELKVMMYLGHAVFF